MSRLYNVLLLCSGNSGRSIMAESILSKIGRGKFAAFSAGSHPTGRVNPLAIEQLALADFPVHGLSSKHWHHFASPSSPPLDFVITVCHLADKQPQPDWTGEPIRLNWNFVAPGSVQGSDAQIRQAFAGVLQEIHVALKKFVRLPVGEVDRTTLESMAKVIRCATH